MYWIVIFYSLTNESINPLSPKAYQATIIVNIINICCALISLVVRLLGYISSKLFCGIFDNDEGKQDLGFINQYALVPVVLAGVAILVLSLGTWGVNNYIGWSWSLLSGIVLALA
jgi:hypothetical protein